MSSELRTQQPQQLATLDPNIIQSLVINGDLSKLDATQTVQFYNYKCQQAGLDPAAKPFDLLVLNGKKILYANAGASQQLTNNRKLSHKITDRQKLDDVYMVFCRVEDSEGRSTENMGAVTIANLKGEALANAMMKATTKAIRRAVLAHCGLGVMDEDEVVGQEWTKETSHGADPQTVTGTTVVDTWDNEALSAFEAILDRAYAAFKAAGQPIEAYNDFAAKWKTCRKDNAPAETLEKFEGVVKKLEDAAAKKAQPDLGATA